jgi:hypothetical protein
MMFSSQIITLLDIQRIPLGKGVDSTEIFSRINEKAAGILKEYKAICRQYEVNIYAAATSFVILTISTNSLSKLDETGIDIEIFRKVKQDGPLGRGL